MEIRELQHPRVAPNRRVRRMRVLHCYLSALAGGYGLLVAPVREASAQVVRAQTVDTVWSSGRVVASRGRVQATLDSIAQANVGTRTAGFVAIVMRGRDTIAARAYGLADVENDVPMTLNHVFQFASITKQFTATAVLTLADSGLVALDAPITKYLPNAPVRGESLTVRQLLAHTSGIPDVTESPRLGAIKRLDLPADSVIALIGNTPLYFTPGDQMRYSNTNYLVLGQLIERVTAKPYAEYVEAHVLRPAGATGAHFCNPQRLVRHIARGYSFTPDGLQPASYISPRVPWSAGGFCGTAGDLTAWNLSVHGREGGGVISTSRYHEMIRPATVRGGRRGRYGLGVQLGQLAGQRMFAHGGDIDGFTTFAGYLPDHALSVAILINTQGPLRPDAVAEAVVAAALGTPARNVTGTRQSPPDLSVFAGEYGGDVVFTAAKDGGGKPALRVKRGPMPSVLLAFVARDAHGWTFSDGRAHYTFEPLAAASKRSAAVWADLGVALVRWERSQ